MRKRSYDWQNVDWQAIGLKCGVEIHQQLMTDKKLFCRCPAGLYTKNYDARVVRHMRPTLSELGEYDGTALMEFKTKKNITYLLDRRSVCTYEMDDTPPFEINREAVDIALDISLALGCQIVGEIHVARKQYLDGSIPTGFQRTAIVGVSGSLPYRGRRIGIIQVSLEEDACREVRDCGHDIVFRTDRLSMPLVEVVTEPHMRTPEEAAEVVNLIGRVMRSTGRVRRGAGATRQDVNVSVEGGVRVEIKGVPSISLIPGLVAGEGIRQRSLLDMRGELLSRGISPDEVECNPVDVGHMLERTSSEPILRALSAGQVVKAVRLAGMRDIIVRKVGTNRTVADEITGRVRVIACLDEAPILIHSGDYAANGISEAEWRAVRKRLRAKAQDAVAVLRGPEVDVDLGLAEVVTRIREIFAGIPNETRQVLGTGETDFERILPGPDRMYPDTDSAPLAVSDEWLAALRQRTREPVWDRDARLAAQGLPAHFIEALAISSRLVIHDRAVAAGVPPLKSATLLVQSWATLRRQGVGLDKVPDGVVLGLLVAAGRGEVTFAALPELLAQAAAWPEVAPADLIRRCGFQRVEAGSLRAEVKRLAASVEKPRTADPAARLRYYMGAVMPALFGGVPGSEVSRAVAREIGIEG